MKRHFYSVKRWLSMVSCAALMAGMASIVSFPAVQAETPQEPAADIHDVNLSLGDWNQITENFDSWYTDQISPDQQNPAKETLQQKSVGDLWGIKTEDNGDRPRLYRTEQHSGVGLDDQFGQNRRVAVLVYKKNTYTNFELEVDYLQGLNSWKWAMVGFGLHTGVPERDILGNNGGYLAYYQQEGDAIVWGKGQTPVNGDVQAGASRISGPRPEAGQYDRNVKHTMKLTVKNKKLTVQTDDLTVFEATLPDSYDGGYIALAAGCNQAEFSNLKIRELFTADTVDPVAPVEAA